MKKLFPFLIGLLVMMASVAAFNMPHPIYGKITDDGYLVKGLDVEVKNLDTNAYSLTETNENGFYQVDLGNIDDRYHDGDIIQVSLYYCKDEPECKKTVTVSGGGNEVTFDIEEESLPDLPDDGSVEVLRYVCSDGTIVASSSDCPGIVTSPVYVCYDGTEVSDKEDCPKEPDELATPLEIALGILSGILAIAFAVLAKFKWGKGFVGLANYYKKLGDEAKAKGYLETAKKNYKRAAKMVSTAVKKAKDGSYE